MTFGCTSGQRCRVDAQPAGRSRREVLYEDIGAGQQFFQDLAPRGRLHVQRDGFLGAGEPHEIAGLPVDGLVVVPGEVPVAGTLDLNHPAPRSASCLVANGAATACSRLTTVTRPAATAAKETRSCHAAPRLASTVGSLIAAGSRSARMAAARAQSSPVSKSGTSGPQSATLAAMSLRRWRPAGTACGSRRLTSCRSTAGQHQGDV